MLTDCYVVDDQTVAKTSGGGAMTNLGTLGGVAAPESYAYGINDSGQVTGYSDVFGGNTPAAFLYSGSVMTKLGPLGGSNFGFDINSSGQVTGGPISLGFRLIGRFSIVAA